MRRELHAENPPVETDRPAFRDALIVWMKIGFLSFGGPAGQIALMHRELVDERRWISEERFLHALNFSMLLPGPEAQQLATYIGWLLHGWRGGVVAGTLFVLPGFFVMLFLSAAYALWGETTLLAGLFDGLKAAVLAIVIEALLRVGRRSLKNRTQQFLAISAFIALFAFSLPFPLVILAAGLIGVFSTNWLTTPPRQDKSEILPESRATLKGSITAVSIWAALWILPFALIFAFNATGSAYWDIAAFFSKMAIVTFGGAYAVLSYVGQQAVSHYHWLKPGEMLDGLGLAETTPGPLVLVLTFVGFMAAYRTPGALIPLAGGILGAVLTTWVTFIPCFLWIFLGAPWIEKLRENRLLSTALSAISAAVVGVIANLAIWFGIHVLFARTSLLTAGPLHMSTPEFSSLDPAALFLTIISIVLLFVLKMGTLKTLGMMSAIGILLRFVSLI